MRAGQSRPPSERERQEFDVLTVRKGWPAGIDQQVFVAQAGGCSAHACVVNRGLDTLALRELERTRGSNGSFRYHAGPPDLPSNGTSASARGRAVLRRRHVMLKPRDRRLPERRIRLLAWIATGGLPRVHC